MSDFLDKAIEYSRQERDANLLSVECRKLGKTIYFKPLAALSIEKFDQVLLGESQKNIEGLINILIARALDKNGSPLFSPMDRLEMKKELSPLLLAEIVQSFGSVEAESDTVEDIEKNL